MTPEQRVDQRSHRLIGEFQVHLRGLADDLTCGMSVEEIQRRSIAFEGWALQKIAGLQLVVEEMSKSPLGVIRKET